MHLPSPLIIYDDQYNGFNNLPSTVIRFEIVGLLPLDKSEIGNGFELISVPFRENVEPNI